MVRNEDHKYVCSLRASTTLTVDGSIVDHVPVFAEFSELAMDAFCLFNLYVTCLHYS